MSFAYIDATALAAWAAYIMWQPCIGMDVKSAYKKRKLPAFAPPSWVFGIIWMILHLMLIVAAIFFTKYGRADSWELITGTVAFALSVLAGKYWMIAYWKRESPVFALILLAGVMIPSIIYFIVMCCIGAMTDFFYVPVIMSSVYLAWLLFALAINVYVVMNDQSKENLL